MDIYGSVTCIILAILALWDAKRMEIPIPLIVAGIVMRIVQFAVILSDDILQIYPLSVSLIPGLLLCILTLILKDRIGAGDGPVLLMALAGLCREQLFTAVAVIGIVSFVTGLLLLILKKDRSLRIPYVPVIAVGSIASYFFI